MIWYLPSTMKHLRFMTLINQSIAGLVTNTDPKRGKHYCLMIMTLTIIVWWQWLWLLELVCNHFVCVFTFFTSVYTTWCDKTHFVKLMFLSSLRKIYTRIWSYPLYFYTTIRTKRILTHMEVYPWCQRSPNETYSLLVFWQKG